MECLFISPSNSVSEQLKRLCCGNNAVYVSKSYSGIGKLYRYNRYGFITMTTRRDISKVCARINNANVKLQPQRMAIVKSGAITYATMRLNNFDIPPSMYILNDRMSFNDFMSRTNVYLTNESDGIFQKRKRKKKTPPKSKKRKIDVVEAETEAETCIICMDNKITHMMLPCTHFQYCGPCAAVLDK